MVRTAVGRRGQGDTVIFDVGTSVLEVARTVSWDWGGTVLTNALPVAASLVGRTGVDVLLFGDRVRRGDLAMPGSHTTAFFRDHFADVAFLGSGGVRPGAGLTDFHPDAALAEAPDAAGVLFVPGATTDHDNQRCVVMTQP